MMTEEEKKKALEELEYYKTKLDRLKEQQAQIVQDFFDKQQDNSNSEE